MPSSGLLMLRSFWWLRMFSSLLLVVGELTLSAPYAAGLSEQAGEYEVKAAILYNLSRFVEWPPSTYPDPQTPTALCILGRDPFEDFLTSLTKNQNASGRPVLIRHLKNERGIRDCQVLYISSSERKSVAQILSTLKGSTVLTVGEMSQFAAQGGIVQFKLEERQMHFDINLEAASRMGLKISSRLLVLARIVKGRDPESGTGEQLIAQPSVLSAKILPSLAAAGIVAGCIPFSNILLASAGSQFK
jgi:uncharacterized protein DUF4154